MHTPQQLAPYLQAQKSSRYSAVLILTVIFGPLALMGGTILYIVGRMAGGKRFWQLLALLTIIGLGYAGWHWHDLRDAGLDGWIAVQKLGAALRPLLQAGKTRTPTAMLELWAALWACWPPLWLLWRWGLCGIPLLALYVNGTRLKTASEQEQARREQEMTTQRARSQAAAKRSTRAPEAANKQLVLGAPVGGDLPWLARGWVVYPQDVLGRHLALIGGSGMGKSETALRLAYGAACVYGWKVFFLDAKGDRAMADRFWAAMHTAGRKRIAMAPLRAYDGWRGNGTALLNRLVAVLDFAEPFYRDMVKLVLSLALDAPGGPPRTSAELLQRLHLPLLQQLYTGHPDVYELEGVSKERINDTYNRYRAFFHALDGTLDGYWAWEDVDAGYLLLDGLALKEQAVSLGRYLMEDFAHYVAHRKPPGEQVLLIIDEFSALAIGGTDAASLFERVRSYGASVVVTSQSYAGMGQGADRILGAAAAVIVHQCPDPERLVVRAGMTEHLEQRAVVTERVGLGGVKTYATGQATIQQRVDARVPVETVQQLDRGECVIIASGAAQQVRVSQLRLSPETVEAAHAALEQQTNSTQPPQSARRRRKRAVVAQDVPPTSLPVATEPAPQRASEESDGLSPPAPIDD